MILFNYEGIARRWAENQRARLRQFLPADIAFQFEHESYRFRPSYEYLKTARYIGG
jgi:hypothetical protein